MRGYLYPLDEIDGAGPLNTLTSLVFRSFTVNPIAEYRIRVQGARWFSAFRFQPSIFGFPSSSDRTRPCVVSGRKSFRLLVAKGTPTRIAVAAMQQSAKLLERRPVRLKRLAADSASERSACGRSCRARDSAAFEMGPQRNSPQAKVLIPSDFRGEATRQPGSPPRYREATPQSESSRQGGSRYFTAWPPQRSASMQRHQLESGQRSAATGEKSPTVPSESWLRPGALEEGEKSSECHEEDRSRLGLQGEQMEKRSPRRIPRGGTECRGLLRSHPQPESFQRGELA